MDAKPTTQNVPPAITNAGMDYSEELLAEVDEPPDEQMFKALPVPKLSSTIYDKTGRNTCQRRESLLTRQLHSEAEQTDEDYAPPRALSTQSTWSNPSVASTAELTSDDGHSVPSPAISPPLLPTAMNAAIPISQKMLATEPKIVGNENSNAGKQTAPVSEQSVEANLGRRRCISFACGAKDKKAPTSAPKPQPVVETATPSPPKRKCALKFICPTRVASTEKVVDTPHTSTKRASSPPPSASKLNVATAHRGSDSTITHGSPKNVRKSPAIVTTMATPTTSTNPRRFSNDSDDLDEKCSEATRFHEFASSDGEPEDWVQESTCHRSRLTINDTLKKEAYLRTACGGDVVEEDEDEPEADEAEDEDDLEGNDDDEGGIEIEEESEEDEGFRTDDEEGFAESDSEAEDSDEDWWRPGALSTAATSIDNMEKLLPHPKVPNNTKVNSAVGSLSSSGEPQRSFISRSRRRSKSLPRLIAEKSDAADLPDSTDFVCGTLDEDRPLEQAYINTMKEREAAKHKARPQDIDPTFPTSDPEMDEEDDEDLEDPEESESEAFMHGELEELDDGDCTARRKGSPHPRAVHRSPPLAPRHRSPAPLKRTFTRSPPPPKRNVAHSPPPRKLFGTSPMPRARSPTPGKRMTSPPNTQRASPAGPRGAISIQVDGLATRSQLTHTASLPRGGFRVPGAFDIEEDDEEVVGTSVTRELPKRGAIDIVKGLEKKRQRRKEKLYQKACAKAAAKGEKPYKVKPGKGAERMREVGLELQRYHGKGQHILSM